MLEARNITKKFGGVTALSRVNMVLPAGKVTAIIGENGAGKSTLMKIFSGVHKDYEGEIWLNGKSQHFTSTRDAEDAGITIIHQELNLVPFMSVTENIFLGREIVNSLGVLDYKAMIEKAKFLLENLHLSISPDTHVGALKVGEQQMVEIAKALHANADVIIMDEPTSAISDKEVEHLFAIMQKLKASGKTIAFISHKIRELFTIADEYVVLRDGCTVGQGSVNGMTQDELIAKMTGRQLSLGKTGCCKDAAPELLRVENMSLRHPLLPKRMVVNDVSFCLRRGEILGIYGLMGAGRTELMECIFGLHPRRGKGSIYLDGKRLRIHTAADAIAQGIALVPEDRKLHGLLLDQSIRSNISITVLSKLEKWGMMLLGGKERKLADESIRKLHIKTSSQTLPASALSGGNQQKIVLAKWLATSPKVLLLDEPTRGIDINAKAEIYKLMKTLAAEGMGIIMVSSELPEILAVSDRVLVMCEGELSGNVPIANATENNLLAKAIHKQSFAL